MHHSAHADIIFCSIRLNLFRHQLRPSDRARLVMVECEQVIQLLVRLVGGIKLGLR